jgi:plasmid maintenance system antidote protein VapI
MQAKPARKSLSCKSMAALDLPLMTTSDLREIVQKAIKKFGTKRALAAALHVVESQAGRIANGDVTSTSVETCLRLADFVELKAAAILQAANKGDIVTLIEKHFGPGRERVPVRLTPDDERALAVLRNLSPRQRQFVLGLIEAFVDARKRAA